VAFNFSNAVRWKVTGISFCEGQKIKAIKNFVDTNSEQEYFLCAVHDHSRVKAAIFTAVSRVQ
jgi:hypothetical protein